MKYGISIINFGPGLDARGLAAFARDAEEAGWDGFFIWDHISMGWPMPFAEVTVSLAAIALATERIRFGALMTPLPRRSPAKFAREAIELDHLSGGRLIAGEMVELDGLPCELGRAAPGQWGHQRAEAEALGRQRDGGERYRHIGEGHRPAHRHVIPDKEAVPARLFGVAGKGG